jgi:hypothetical protein
MYRYYFLFFFNACYSASFAQINSGNYLYRCNEKLVEVIMEDLFTPPVASRVHVYPNIAAYEVLCLKYNNLNSLGEVFANFEKITEPNEGVDYSLSALTAFTTVAKKLVYSEYMITDFEQDEYSKWLSENMKDTARLSRSVTHGKAAAGKCMVWIKKDNYDFTRTLTRYQVVDTAGAWQPTGPAYSNAIEPNWYLIRSLLFDSTTMMKSTPCIPYSEDKNSKFYKDAFDVYKQSLQLDNKQKLIANFWDCNPNITKVSGHFTYFIHKISPGGHWVRITGQAVKNSGLNERNTSRIYTTLTIALFEGFLSCWTDKYKYNLVRPETYINKLISPKWVPFIETPPFPEYPSGHSVISGSAATVLTGLIPQPYAFTDSSEMYIDLPPRHFNSFQDAAFEASMSRFYGGIHFLPALENGLTQGREIGNIVLKKLTPLWNDK